MRIERRNNAELYSLVTYSNDRIKIVLKDASGVYGGGEHYDAVDFTGLVRRNEVREVFTNQGEATYFPVPIAVSDNVSIYLDTDRVFDMEARRMDDDIVLSIVGELDEDDVLYVIGGKPRYALKEIADLQGMHEPAPSWIYGQWASANRWHSRKDAESAIEEAERNGIPISVIVLEAWSDEATFYRWNDEEDGLWPDMPSFMEKLREKGIHLILWQCPVFKKLEAGRHHEVHEKALAEIIGRNLEVLNPDGTPYTIPDGHWFSGSMIPDFTNPETREWWFEKRKHLLDLGVSGFKTDGGEFVLSDDCVFHDGSTGLTMRNRYPESYVRAYSDAIGRDRIVFSRAGYIGSRNSSIFWAGDQMSTWKELGSVLNAGLSASISGIYDWGFDIAGFAGPMPSRELYIRSFELATFVPIMQWHSEPIGGQFSEIMKSEDAVNDRSPWNMASIYGNDILDICRRYSLLRERLRSYLEILGQKDEPIIRPMLYDFDDLDVKKVFDEYMLGPSLLVAPVIAEGQVVRSVVIPSGRWLDVASGEVMDGGRTIEFSCPIDSIGLFIMLGSEYEDELRTVFGV